MFPQMWICTTAEVDRGRPTGPSAPNAGAAWYPWLRLSGDRRSGESTDRHRDVAARPGAPQAYRDNGEGRGTADLVLRAESRRWLDCNCRVWPPFGRGTAQEPHTIPESMPSKLSRRP